MITVSSAGKLFAQYLPLLIPLVTAILAWRTTQAHRPESGRLSARTQQRPPTLFNGYAPLIRDMLARLEQYQQENEALRLEIAELKGERTAVAQGRESQRRRARPSAPPHTESASPPPRPPSTRRRKRPTESE